MAQKTGLITLDVERLVDRLDDATLGARLREYVKESNHQGWDGYAKRELRGALTLLRDFRLFCEAYDGGGRS